MFQSRTVWSAPAEASVWPSGLNATPETSPRGRRERRRTAVRVRTFHSRIVASLLPDASVWPSGLNATLLTVPPWPVSDAIACACGCPRAGPCGRWPAEASVWPSGLNATSITAPSWLVSGVPSCLWVCGSQSRIVPSPPAEASVRPSGLNADALDGVGMAVHDCEDARITRRGERCEDAAPRLDAWAGAVGLEREQQRDVRTAVELRR